MLLDELMFDLVEDSKLKQHAPAWCINENVVAKHELEYIVIGTSYTFSNLLIFSFIYHKFNSYSNKDPFLICTTIAVLGIPNVP